MNKNNKNTRGKWANRSLITGIASIFLSLCTAPVSGVPLGIPFGIFAIAFAVISKDKEFKGSAVAGFVTGSIGIFIGLIIYAMIMFIIVNLRNPDIASRIPAEQLKVIQDFIQMYVVH